MTKDDKIQKVVSGYDEISHLEGETISIKCKLTELLEKEKDHEYILFNMMFISDTQENLDDDPSKIKVAPDGFNDIYIEIPTQEAIEILNIMLNRRIESINKISDELNNLFK